MSTPPPDPGRVLRLALVAWGLGHLALGRTAVGAALLVGETVGIGLVVALGVSMVDTTLQLIPFLAGIGFIVVWAWQAVSAFRAARPPAAAEPPSAGGRSPAVAIAWLSLPLLVWTSGFWLLPSAATAPSAALDRFVSDWTDDDLRAAGWPRGIATAADDAAERLDELCDDDQLRAGCEVGGSELFRDVRIRISRSDETSALAVAEAVRYEPRATSFLWLFPGTELVPVPIDRILELDLAAEPAADPLLDLGARRWQVVDARP